MSGIGRASAGATIPLYRDGGEVRWRDPGVDICLRCPLEPPPCSESDEGAKSRLMTMERKPRCLLVLARLYLGDTSAVLPVAERLAAQTLDPDRPNSVRWYERALEIEADRQKFLAELQEQKR